MTPTELAQRVDGVLAGLAASQPAATPAATPAASPPAATPTPTGTPAATQEGTPAAQTAATIAYDQVSVLVPRELWVRAVTAVRDDPGLACTFFDRLTAVDEGPAGFELWLHLWSPAHRHGLQLRTRCPRDDAQIPSLAGVFAGAAWHERETAEMFAIDFPGHPDLRPLLLPDGFQGHPLRKDFVLAARVAKEWPGRKEPGEAVGDRPPRRRLQPPGVPGPGGWPA